MEISRTKKNNETSQEALVKPGIPTLTHESTIFVFWSLDLWMRKSPNKSQDYNIYIYSVSLQCMALTLRQLC